MGSFETLEQRGGVLDDWRGRTIPCPGHNNMGGARNAVHVRLYIFLDAHQLRRDFVWPILFFSFLHL